MGGSSHSGGSDEHRICQQGVSGVVKGMYVGSFVWLLDAMKNRLTYARQPVEIKALVYTACDKFATYRIDTAVLKKNEVVSSAPPAQDV